LSFGNIDSQEIKNKYFTRDGEVNDEPEIPEKGFGRNQKSRNRLTSNRPATMSGAGASDGAEELQGEEGDARERDAAKQQSVVLCSEVKNPAITSFYNKSAHWNISLARFHL
jgi:hypothetical protein